MNFATPSLLFLIPVTILLLLIFLWIGTGKRKNRSQLFAENHLIQRLIQSHSSTRKRLKWLFFCLGLILVIFSMARPQWGFEFHESKGKGIDFVIALDTSKSMLAEDIRPNRLMRSKLAVLDLVQQLQGDRIGLVAFSGSAFLQCPLTLDYDAFTQSLNALDTSIINRGGTDISLAIAESKAAFAKDSENKIIVLITDGEDLEASGIKEAKAAAEEGIRIYTVGVGSDEGEFIPVRDGNGKQTFLKDQSGKLVKTKLDADTLKIIGSVTGGFYVSLNEVGGLDQVYEQGLALVPEEERKLRMEEIPIERYQAFALVALGLLFLEPLIQTRRKTPKES